MATGVRQTVTLEEDPDTGELVLPLSQEILEQLGWNIGDNLTWTDNSDGTFTITNDVDKSAWKVLKSYYE